MFTTKSAAKTILESTQKIYAGAHCYAIVEAKNFSHLNLDFYENLSAELQTYNCRYIADVENLIDKNWHDGSAMFYQTLSEL